MWQKDGQDLVFSGVENGIAPSPTKGVAALQNVNIATETGEALASFARFKQDQAQITNGTLTASVSDGSYLLDAPATLQAGDWITVSNSTIPSVVSTASYLVLGGGGGGGGAVASEASGGGGAGGFVASTFTPTVGAYDVTVGLGGDGGATGVVGTNGGLSSINKGTTSFTYLVAGGGGGGAGTPAVGGGGDNKRGGGGGGGQIATGTTLVTGGQYAITVGTGGAGGVGDNNGTNGVTSTAIGITAVGGGGGGKIGTNGLSGASGGGGGSPTGTGGTATAGNIGGNGAQGGGSDESSGGGGGAGTAGGNGTGVDGGSGGNGVASSITGSSVTRGGGGGGSGGAGGTGGTGGGGAGANNNTNGAAGTANTGGGGGGSGTAAGFGPFNGGAGGSGVVILRFVTASINYVQAGGVVTTDGADTIITWSTSGTFAFSTVNISPGGGGGGSPGVANGQLGASGGGGASGGTATAGGAYAGRGSAGGVGDDSGDEAGGGGGGASAVGGAATDGVGGNGGDGSSSSISGTSTTYAGGGGGGCDEAPGLGGAGGGGNGTSGPPVNGTDGLGGGGGGNFGVQAGGDGGNGIVIISYVTGTMSATGGAITTSGGNTIHTFTSSGTFTVNSIATAGQYFVSYKNSSNKVKLSAIFDPYGLYPIVHGTTGTATFSTLAVSAAGVAKATERYNSANQNYFRYYILDSNSRTWVYDSQVYATTLLANGVGEAWMLPDPTDYSAEHFTGIVILNGWLVQVNNTNLWGKPTEDLGRAFDELLLNGVEMRCVTPFPTHKNPAYVGVQGKMYYGDRNYLGELFPISSIASGLANVQSFSSFTGSGATGTLTSVVSGSSPFLQNSAGDIARVPVVFLSTQTTGVPAGLTEGVVYWAAMSQQTDRVFNVYEDSTGGSQLTLTTAGTSYFNTFYPLGDQEDTAGTYTPLFQFSQQRLNLPTFEEIQCMVEVGNTVIIGCRSNNLYPWNQVDALPNQPIALPESDTIAMVNANNMAYVLAGNKGNVYITNGASASIVLKIPDYCAGVPGTPLTYIEPKFTWGDIDYIRGRIYLSILDQTSTKAGNCGGVWSFVPTQNFYYGQDTGVALRLENQNSYGNYSGMATIILPSQEQDAISPQYWTSWQNSYSIATSTAFGIDQTDDIPVTTFVIETDLISVGTFKSQTTFQEFEFKFTTPLASGDSIVIYWRKTSTDAWVALQGQQAESSVISGEYNTNFENAQWLQLRAEITTNGTSTSSFGRFKELRMK